MTQYSIQTDEYLNTNRSIYEVMMLASESGQVANVTNPIPVFLGDSPNMSAFGRLRTAESRILADYRYMYGSGTSILMNDKIIGNGTINVDFTRVSCVQNVSTANGDAAIRQTKQYHPYIAGTSQQALITYRFDTAKANLTQSTGLFDDSNGIFFRMNGLTPEFVIRKNGSDVEVVPQSSWNLDKLDGSYTADNPNGNPTAIQMDFSKAQILMIDYQWLGVGRVRVGFNVNGVARPAHQFVHANAVTEPYMFQPSLPVRWEIRNTGATTSNSSLLSICGSVYSEGSDIPVGFTRSVSTDGTLITAGASSVTDGICALAVKLKDAVVGKKNYSYATLNHWAVFSNNDARYKIVIFDDETYFNNTPTWLDVPGYSWCRTANNIAMKAGWSSNTNYAVLQDGFVAGAQGVGSGTNSINDINNLTASIYQNYDATQSQVLALIVYKLKTDAEIKATMTWNEIK